MESARACARHRVCFVPITLHTYSLRYTRHTIIWVSAAIHIQLHSAGSAKWGQAFYKLFHWHSSAVLYFTTHSTVECALKWLPQRARCRLCPPQLAATRSARSAQLVRSTRSARPVRPARPAQRRRRCRSRRAVRPWGRAVWQVAGAAVASRAARPPATQGRRVTCSAHAAHVHMHMQRTCTCTCSAHAAHMHMHMQCTCTCTCSAHAAHMQCTCSSEAG